MHLKIHTAYRLIVALSDTELLGKKFEEGNRQIELHPHFFAGDVKTEEELIPLLKELVTEDATFNIVGKKSIETALKAEIIDSEGVITIQGVPVALKLL